VGPGRFGVWIEGDPRDLAGSRRKFSPEFKEEAVKLVVESSRSIKQVAGEIGVNETTLGNWVKKYRQEHPEEEEPLSISERAELQQLRKEARELKMENEFLKKAAAFFAKEQR
jgi:transposase